MTANRYMTAFLVASLLALSAAGVRAQPPAAKMVSIDIAPQALSDALTELGKQTGLQVVLYSAIAKQSTTARLTGKFTAEAALTKLLADTGLRYEYLDARTIAILSKSQKLLPTGALVETLPLDAVLFAQAGQGTDALPDADASKDAKKSKSAKTEGAVEEMIVEESKIRPFSDANVDMPRTINDHQPYYIFNSETIQRSGAANIEDFLKQRLTMNTTSQTNAEMSAGNNLENGNISNINLRGLGSDKTLILVNGRRMTGVNVKFNDYQPDVNGIPLSAVERIEVLPSSASGIYGGSAIGGVINIILKRNYTGGEIRATHEDVWQGSAPKRALSFSYGTSSEDGKTNFSISASWSDAQPLLLADRSYIYSRNVATLLNTAPNFVYATAYLGSLPNIKPYLATQTNLVLKNGNVPLNAIFTHVPAGASSSTSASDLSAGFLANAGRWNLDVPDTAQQRTGLRQSLGQTPEVRSVVASVRRQLTPRLQLSADVAYAENTSSQIRNPFSGAVRVTALAPTNPFTTDVYILNPDAGYVTEENGSENRSVAVGLHAELPGKWVGMLDYSWSENRSMFLFHNSDTDARNADLLSGALNLFVDSLAHPLNLAKYIYPVNFNGVGSLQDLALRGSGPVLPLPWGQPYLTVGLEHRVAVTNPRTLRFNYAISPFAYDERYYRRETVAESAYAEAVIPLVKKDWFPGIRNLDFQIAGRSERFIDDIGTRYLIDFDDPARAPIYFGATLNGQPFFDKATYSSSNHTAAIRYQPIQDLTVRLSRATAFLPPQPTQLTKNPQPDTSQTSVQDPVTGRLVLVNTLSGGNPDLEPQNSRSFNAGVIWEPRSKVLEGLRLNVEYYKIEQFDAIGSLSAQQIVSQEGVYSDRVVRDSAGTITLVDRSNLNLFRRETEGWDFSADYSLRTRFGQFGLHAVESMIMHLKEQYSQTLPLTDAVNFPGEGGAAKYKTNATLDWQNHGWELGWTVRYFSSYRQSGAPDGPNAMRSSPFTLYIVAGGRDTIPAQTYHDFYASYRFRSQEGKTPARGMGRFLEGMALQVNVRNVFDTVAPFDPFYGPYYISPYGGGLLGLRTFAVSVRKEF